MARIRGHERLDEDRTLYVKVAELTAGDVTYKRGDELPWRRIPGVGPRLIRQLHDQRKIGHEHPGDDPAGAEGPDLSETRRPAPGVAASSARPKVVIARGRARGLG